MAGYIPARETRKVVERAMLQLGLAPHLYSFHKGGINVLIGTRIEFIRIPPKQTFFSVEDIVKQVCSAARDALRLKEHKNQVDLEDLIRRAESAVA